MATSEERSWLRDAGRVEAFSDGVIAIAITLLVLEVRVPHLEDTGEGSRLWEALRDLWPAYLGYLLSFTVIGIMWANHHHIFGMIARVTHGLLLLNGLLLLLIAFLPFPTALLAEYLTHEGEQTAVVVYSGWLLACALSYWTLWYYICRSGVLREETGPTTVATITRRFNYGPPSYLIAFILAFVYPPASLALIGLLALLYLLPSGGEAGPDRTASPGLTG